MQHKSEPFLRVAFLVITGLIWWWVCRQALPSAVNLSLIVGGIVLLVLGFNEAGTFGSRAGRMLGASLSNKVLFFFIAGGICTAYGIMQMVKKK